MVSAAAATKDDVARTVRAGIDDVLEVLGTMMTRIDERPDHWIHELAGKIGYKLSA